MPSILFLKRASNQLQRVKENNESDFVKISKELDILVEYPDIGTLWIKKLKGEYSDCFCLKTGKFRIKFVFEDKNIYIVDIRNRKDAYKK